ncbi:hypothetical protein [Streptomyces europaeiscabiei]|uniref:Integral membrane protein n=1 Tax=Streptomyces europaeiscabiei TaxID=146819 RepID=A0ABU4NR74_9ACTN|nr:hypothetical protein [Streptomyces europaeiscabiei]MDX2528251.1 hypothetical protein [Streptomyces europaeiscabiei]MDX2766801.1 hypothetical protein [Streptomyces europaeiscabiei]MDX3547528.1 hypothetical protein [Streptomyces europaeiscabiei]MDX3557963.1 hypothetical protein [Streptomyces europaeiscabiei]MDX3584705.1 hypothetical protein [Streptomyces europaeiscabiei]
MFSLIVGILLIVFGVCLIGDFGRIATRLYTFFADFMNPGRATAKTFRVVGVIAVLLGVGWVGTSFPVG